MSLTSEQVTRLKQHIKDLNDYIAGTKTMTPIIMQEYLRAREVFMRGAKPNSSQDENFDLVVKFIELLNEYNGKHEAALLSSHLDDSTKSSINPSNTDRSSLQEMPSAIQQQLDLHVKELNEYLANTQATAHLNHKKDMETFKQKHLREFKDNIHYKNFHHLYGMAKDKEATDSVTLIKAKHTYFIPRPEPKAQASVGVARKLKAREKIQQFFIDVGHNIANSHPGESWDKFKDRKFNENNKIFFENIGTSIAEAALKTKEAVDDLTKITHIVQMYSNNPSTSATFTQNMKQGLLQVLETQQYATYNFLGATGTETRQEIKNTIKDQIMAILNDPHANHETKKAAAKQLIKEAKDNKNALKSLVSDAEAQIVQTIKTLESTQTALKKGQKTVFDHLKGINELSLNDANKQIEIIYGILTATIHTHNLSNETNIKSNLDNLKANLFPDNSLTADERQARLYECTSLIAAIEKDMSTITAKRLVESQNAIRNFRDKVAATGRSISRAKDACSGTKGFWSGCTHLNSTAMIDMKGNRAKSFSNIEKTLEEIKAWVPPKVGENISKKYKQFKAKIRHLKGKPPLKPEDKACIYRKRKFQIPQIAKFVVEPVLSKFADVNLEFHAKGHCDKKPTDNSVRMNVNLGGTHEENITLIKFDKSKPGKPEIILSDLSSDGIKEQIGTGKHMNPTTEAQCQDVQMALLIRALTSQYGLKEAVRASAITLNNFSDAQMFTLVDYLTKNPSAITKEIQTKDCFGDKPDQDPSIKAAIDAHNTAVRARNPKLQMQPPVAPVQVRHNRQST